MSTVKVALIGAGGMANKFHYPSVASFQDVDIVGLCDLNDERCSATAKSFGITQTFNDYRRMLDTTHPDAVYVLMPPYHLFDVAMDVIERGHALFVEKPPAVSSHQARSLARRATDMNIISAVGFQRRYQPMLVQCLEKVKAKGEIHQVVACFYKNQDPAAVHPYYRGAIDILRCDAIHAIDALRFYAGLSEVVSVASQVSNLDCWYAVQFNALVQFASGVVGILMANWRTGKRFFNLEVHGYGAMAYATIDGEATVWADNSDQPMWRTDYRKAADSDEDHMHQGFYAENRAFIDAVQTQAPLHNSLQDAVKSMELADMIYDHAINN